MNRADENIVWDMGPAKFARRGHERCRGEGVVYVWTGDVTTATGRISEHDPVLCTCVRVRVARRGIVPVRRRVVA